MIAVKAFIQPGNIWDLRSAMLVMFISFISKIFYFLLQDALRNLLEDEQDKRAAEEKEVTLKEYLENQETVSTGALFPVLNAMQRLISNFEITPGARYWKYYATKKM